jgi:hypothetical protein
MDNYKNNLINNMDMASKSAKSGASSVTEQEMVNKMSDPAYLRQSSALINDALQKGFDVMQLADGDIVMTGMKTVIYQYTWDANQGKLVRNKAVSHKETPAMAKPTVNTDEPDDVEDTEFNQEAENAQENA